MSYREDARAKINLTLRVLGRRPDGYHEIESLVAFAGIGDSVTLVPGNERGVAVSGPFAGEIEGRNLLDTALGLLAEHDPMLRLGSVALDKRLPVAAGLGGGSADAAALLRAVRRANPERAGLVPWHEIAVRLGADVPVCLAGMPALISGIGDRVQPLAAPGLPTMAAVLANPGLPLATAEVYRALAAEPVPTIRPPPPSARPFADLAYVTEFVRRHGNDLEQPAIALRPEIAEVKAALVAEPGCCVAAMSGSGPTCFGIFAGEPAARTAAEALARRHPRWWIAATQLGGGGTSGPRGAVGG